MPESEVDAGSEVESVPIPLHGSFEFRYLGRWTDGARDHDIWGYGDVAWGDAATDFVTARASGRTSFDLDGNSDPDDPFRNVDDSFRDDLTARLYSAHVDFNGVKESPLEGVLHRVRVGRQILNETPETLFLDGVSIESVPMGGAADITLQAYGGSPRHLFESSRDDDWMAGAAVHFAPWTAARLRIDYIHVTDSYLSVTNRDDLFGVRFEQRLSDGLFFTTHLNLLDFDEARDYGAYLQWARPESDLTITARYTALFSDQTRRSIDFDYFTALQQTYFAYDQVDLSVYKGIGEHLYLDGGVQFRELRDDEDEGLFNHEFRRYHASPGFAEWPWKGFDASATFEWWDAQGDEFLTIGGDLTQRFSEQWRMSLGTLFERFRYDVFVDQEREDVYVTYARATWRPVEDVRVRALYEWEDGDTQDFTTFSLSMRVDF